MEPIFESGVERDDMDTVVLVAESLTDRSSKLTASQFGQLRDIRRLVGVIAQHFKNRPQLSDRNVFDEEVL